MSQESAKAPLPDRIRAIILDAVRDKDRVDMGEVENAVTAIVESINHLKEASGRAAGNRAMVRPSTERGRHG